MSEFGAVADLLVSLLGMPEEAPEAPPGVQPAADLNDVPFGQLFYDGVPYVYPDLPIDVKKRDAPWLFYGKASTNPDQSVAHAARLFTYGRTTREKAHRDVWKHQKGIQRSAYGISGFFQASKVLGVVARKYLFDRRRCPAFGALYVIDGSGSDVLDVDRFCEWIGRIEPENGEGEVLFSESLPASRLAGAGVYRWDGGDGLRLLQLLINPNYNPRRNNAA